MLSGDMGDESTLITCFPMRQSGRMGRRGSGQISRISLSVPTEALSFWDSRLGDHGIETIVAVRHPKPHEKDQRIKVVSPCGICRELICDYDPKARVIVPNGAEPVVTTITELLPNKYNRGTE